MYDEDDLTTEEFEVLQAQCSHCSCYRDYPCCYCGAFAEDEEDVS